MITDSLKVSQYISLRHCEVRSNLNKGKFILKIAS